VKRWMRRSVAQGGMPWLRLCGLVFWLCLAPAVQAISSTPYGYDFLRSGKTWPDEAPVTVQVSAQDAAITPARLAEQRARLQAMEAAEGPYAASLAVPLADLGRGLSGAGDPLAAARVYSRALHVLRINQGLYSDQQLPLIKELLAAHRSLGDWQALDARYDYYYRLLGGGERMNTRAAADYFRWQREALRRELDSSDQRRLLHLHESNQQLLLATQATLPASQRWYLVDSQLRNLYLVQAQARPDVWASNRGATAPFGFRQEPLQELDVYEQRLLTLQRSAEVQGAQLLLDFIAAPDLQDEALRARAWLALADWRQWNGEGRLAAADYRAVAAHLQATGQQALLEEWFNSPVELPDNGAFTRDPGSGGVLVTARYRVTDDGVARDVETQAEDEADKGSAMRLYRSLLKTRFRPRLEAGAPIASGPVERSYRYFDADTIRRFRSP
jgi:hypothetical protein